MLRRQAKKAGSDEGIRRALAPAYEPLESRRLLSVSILATPAVQGVVGTPGVPGYTPSQVLQAYGFDTQAATIGAVGGDGAGQTIAIIEAYNSPTLAADVETFDQQFNIPDPGTLIEMNQNGGNALPANNPTWALETSLDVEWAHAVAPGANIDVIEAKSAQLSDLLTAVNTARQLSDVSVVSMSWGVNEFASEKLFDNIFTTPAGHQNITFVSSAGDTATAVGVQWPAVSPNVVSVGGTTLEMTSSGGASEAGYAGAVSGTSQYESTGVPGSKSPTDVAVTTPDVVYNANPVPGFSVYDSAAGGWQTLGGTSAGAPQWAALLTIANQVRAEAGQASLDGASQTLPALQASASTVSGATYNAVGLLSASGTPETGKVIGTLAAVTKSAPAPQASSSAASAQMLLATNQAQLPKKPVHPSYLPHILAPVGSIATNAGAFAQATPAVASLSTTSATGSVFSAAPVPTPSLVGSIASADSEIASLAQAMIAGGWNLPARAQSLSQTIAALCKTIPPIFGESEVVRVDAVLLTEEKVLPALYIPRINVSAMLGDGIALFISECLSRPRMTEALEKPPTGHFRAWMITGAMIALDGALIGYVMTRRRRTDENAPASWWHEQVDPALESTMF